jgi:hypothetical protein
MVWTLLAIYLTLKTLTKSVNINSTLQFNIKNRIGNNTVIIDDYKRIKVTRRNDITHIGKSL